MIKVTASPNIAFIKYWGKKDSTSDEDRNIGVNPSLSMTLDVAKTTVVIEKSPRHSIYIDQKEASKEDHDKIVQHITRIEKMFQKTHPQGAGYLNINSENNFPPSAGIASSASAFAALTVGIVAAIIGKPETKKLLKTNPDTLSSLARRGSGSAARSLMGGFVKWETLTAESLNVQWPLLDTIVILSSKAKDVSSSEGHKRALTSPYFAERQSKLPERIRNLENALQTKDFERFGQIIEEEALEMHHVAETSNPPIHYLSEDSKRLISTIQGLKNRSFYFTIDAGPNLHLISTKPIKEEIKSILNNLKLDAVIWEDHLGTGPTLE